MKEKVLFFDIDGTLIWEHGSENDMEMIELCRVGVAIGNSCDALKQKANIICKSIVDHGLADILFSE